MKLGRAPTMFIIFINALVEKNRQNCKPENQISKLLPSQPVALLQQYPINQQEMSTSDNSPRLKSFQRPNDCRLYGTHANLRNFTPAALKPSRPSRRAPGTGTVTTSWEKGANLIEPAFVMLSVYKSKWRK